MAWPDLLSTAHRINEQLAADYLRRTTTAFFNALEPFRDELDNTPPNHGMKFLTVQQSGLDISFLRNKQGLIVILDKKTCRLIFDYAEKHPFTASRYVYVTHFNLDHQRDMVILGDDNTISGINSGNKHSEVQDLPANVWVKEEFLAQIHPINTLKGKADVLKRVTRALR